MQFWARRRSKRLRIFRKERILIRKIRISKRWKILFRKENIYFLSHGATQKNRGKREFLSRRFGELDDKRFSSEGKGFTSWASEPLKRAGKEGILTRKIRRVRKQKILFRSETIYFVSHGDNQKKRKRKKDSVQRGKYLLHELQSRTKEARKKEYLPGKFEESENRREKMLFRRKTSYLMFTMKNGILGKEKLDVRRESHNLPVNLMEGGRLERRRFDLRSY